MQFSYKEVPDRSKHRGMQEMEQLYKLCKRKNCVLGVDIIPNRDPEDLKGAKKRADIILLIATDKPVKDHVIMSDIVTESLQVSAIFLTKELEAL